MDNEHGNGTLGMEQHADGTLQHGADFGKDFTDSLIDSVTNGGTGQEDCLTDNNTIFNNTDDSMTNGHTILNYQTSSHVTDPR